MNAIIKLIIPVFGAIGAFLFVFTVSDFDDKLCNQCWPVELFLYFTYLLFIVSLVAALAGAVSGALSNPASLKKSGLGIGLMLLVMVISYFMATDEVYAYYGDISSTTSKWTDTGLYMLYFLIVGAVGAIVFSGVNSIIKR